MDDGNGFFWGTAQGGGATNVGAVYKVNATTGVLSNEIEFTGSEGTAKGSIPQAGLVSDGNGNLWGSTYSGGSEDSGTIFRIHAGTGTLTTVVEFTWESGARPRGELVAHAGFVWGTTEHGGTTGQGTVFKINQSTGSLETVIEFTGNEGTAKGSWPVAGLAADDSGNLWGVTPNGGSADLGTVFKIHAATGVMTTVIEFTNADGTGVAAIPQGGLTSDGSGSFLGTTSGFGSRGMVYKVHAATGVMTKLTGIGGDIGPVRGQWPSGGMVSDDDGMLWGTTSGTIFKLHPVSGELTTVVDGASSGSLPGPLVNDGTGMLWGTTDYGGASGSGTVFKINTASGALTTVADFHSGILWGVAPQGPLAREGTFYWGTTRFTHWNSGDPAGAGTIFKVNTLTGEVTTVFYFDHFFGEQGAFPSGGLVSDGAGNFWGTTAMGGFSDPNEFGTVFKINVSTGTLTTVIWFTDTGETRGRYPVTGLLDDGAGFLWGTTSSGGTFDGGTIFKVHTATGVIKTVFDLPEGSGGASLMRDPHGCFWGTTAAGGDSGHGTIFRFVPGGPIISVLDFTGVSGAFPGSSPGGLFLDEDRELVGPGHADTAHCWGLYLHRDGNLYGTTATGGVTADGRPSGHGQLFRLRLQPPLASWRQLHFGSAANTGTAADSTDPDLDGMSNLAEFAFGMNPHRNGAGQWPQGQITGGDYVISFPQPPASAALLTARNGAPPSRQVAGPPCPTRALRRNIPSACPSAASRAFSSASR